MERATNNTIIVNIINIRCQIANFCFRHFFVFLKIESIFDRSARKVLENRSLADEERMDALENQLKEARFLAEEADKKYDEVLSRIT